MNGGLWSLLFLLFLAVNVLLIHIAFICLLNPINKCTSKAPMDLEKGIFQVMPIFLLRLAILLDRIIPFCN